MIDAFIATPGVMVSAALAVGTHLDHALPPAVDWIEASHPIPDERSVVAAHRALALAKRVPRDGQLILLLSGGASALVAAPLDGLSLADKQRAIRRMLLAGADIHALNAVRKHLSAVKGGRLAAACAGRTLSLAISDVVGDDLSVIGSGPGVPDPTTWADAVALLERYGGSDEATAAALVLVRRGLAGDLPETPKPGDPSMARAEARVIGGRRDALEGARLAAQARGYHVGIIDEPVVGDARVAAPAWLERVCAAAARLARPACILSAGETTVRVTGRGKGGRNQEFVLALAGPLAALGIEAAAASAGTDGIDGPTTAAGAVVDTTSQARAAARALRAVEAYLDDNDSFTFFAELGDLITTGPTDTNVGDIQAAVFA